ncbi:MAG: hypothetical protein AB7F41_10960 [Methylocystis sp.]|uniref:hypothetical protein n=1 Tax=Methylocystis sp. TaxID=1911079 RepID=UPI003D0B2C9A
MKRFFLTLVASASLIASASIGVAAARDDFLALDQSSVPDHETGMADQGGGWAGAPRARHKAYAWPDQRYYGAHGMVSD